jgi:hypothetical protein
MRTIVGAMLYFCSLLLCHSAELAAGRWHGSAQVPGRTLDLIVDLDQDAKGVWVGSIIIPELNIKGAPLTNILALGNDVSFAIKNALGEPDAGQAKFKAKFDADHAIAGTFEQAGNTTTFTLKKLGAAQVDLPISSTPLAKEFEGIWVGDYEFDGVPRHATLQLTNHDEGAATAKLIFVGKRSNDVPVDMVRQDETLLTVQSSTRGISYEGRVRKETGEMIGTLTQGAFDLPLTLHHPG